MVLRKEKRKKKKEKVVQRKNYKPSASESYTISDLSGKWEEQWEEKVKYFM